jgi:multiple sugar transport system permease protein
VTGGLIICTFITLFPIFWLIVNAFGLGAGGFSFVSVAVHNFETVFDVMGYSYLNSLIIAGTATIINVAICSMSAYAFARIDFRGRDVMYNFLLLPYLLPTVLLIIPLYVTFKTFGVINTYLPLILLYQLLMGPVNVWIGTDFLKSIPKEIEESAMIDGCGWSGVFLKITLPLMVPGLVTMTLLTFIASWNEFVLATTFLNRVSLYTFTKAIFIFSAVNAKGAVDWGFVSAASILGLTPLVIFLLILRKYLISGLAKGAVKA